jgi:hypothetical protein
MPSPWTDLLCLHGYMADPKLLRELVTLPSSPPPREPDPRHPRLTLARQAMTSLRLCLGIGDGALRSQ